jgi:murein DD-endopeptidase MepM/ murein hydrolase activator NlpD
MIVSNRKIMLVSMLSLAAMILVLFLMSLESQAAETPIDGVLSGDVATGDPRPLSASTTCTVTITDDSGSDSLRQCLLNAEVGDIITFDPNVFPATITLTSDRLPDIDQGNITIDGSGAGVIIDGSQLTSVYDDGFRIISNSNTITGLTIQNFPGDGIDIRDGAQGNRIENCVIRGNGWGGNGGRRGVRIDGNGTTGNTITRNSITDNDGPGIENSNGGNQELPWPIITQIVTSTSGITVSGFAQPGVTVEIFADPTTEGQIFLGDDKVDSTRRFAVFSSTTSIEGMNITATVIDSNGNTSEFAQALIWPLSCSITPDDPFSSPFGPRLKASEGFRYDFHRGLDTYTMANTPICAVADGQVRITGTHPAYNSTVVQLCHPDCEKPEYYSNYLHVITSTIPVTKGQMITQGDHIAYSGASENEKQFPHLHFEIRERGLYQKHTVNPFKYLPYTDTVSHTIAINGTYIHTADPGNSPTVTARAVVTSSRNELDFNRIAMVVNNGSGTDQRTIDFQALNKEMTTVENPEILDTPYISDVCIMPARFCSDSNECKEYGIDFVFYGLRGSYSITLTAEAADVHSKVVSTTTSQTAGGITISPDYIAYYGRPGNVVTYTHILNNSSGISHTLNLSAKSAQSWTAKVSPSPISLNNGVQEEVTVYITVPTGIRSGTTDCAVVTATDITGTIQAIAIDVTSVYLSFLPIIMKGYP